MKKRIGPIVAVIVIVALVFTCRSGKGNSSDSTAVKEKTYVTFTGPVYEEAEEYSTGSFTLAAADVDSVNIIWNVGSVTVEGVKGDTISVTEAGTETEESAKLRWRVSDRVLTVMVTSSGFSGSVSPEDKALTVTMPSYLGLSLEQGTGKAEVKNISLSSLDVKSGSGRIYIYRVQAPEAGLSTTSSEIDCDNLTASELDMTSQSGKTKLRNSTVSDSFTVRNSSGPVVIYEAKCGSIDIKTTSGDIDIRDTAASIIEFSTSSGDLDSFEVTSDLLIGENTSGTTYFNELTSSAVSLSSTSGKIQLALVSSPVIEIENTSGLVSLTFASGPEDCSVSTLTGNIYFDEITEESYSITAKTTSGEVISPFESLMDGTSHIIGYGSGNISARSAQGNILINQR